MEIDWDRLASTYGLQEPLERIAVRRLVTLLDPDPGDAVLDVATGTGTVLRELARREEPPGRAIGLDASAAMLARVWGLPHGWSLLRGDARELPFDDASFDVVTASYLLHVLAPDDRYAALAEIARVLRRGGVLGAVTVAETGPLSRAMLRPITSLAERGVGALRSLVPLDPRPEMVAAGLAPTAAARAWLGYPSLCVVAQRSPR